MASINNYKTAVRKIFEYEKETRKLFERIREFRLEYSLEYYGISNSLFLALEEREKQMNELLRQLHEASESINENMV